MATIFSADELVTINIDILGGNVKFGSLIYGSYTDDQVESAAKSLKEKMDARPEGLRYIHFSGPNNTMKLIEKEVYFDETTKQLTELTTALFDKYAALGGTLDGAMMSMLYSDMGAYYINQAAAKDKKLYGKIVKDSRYKTQIRPLLEERGFTFYTEKVSDYTPEIYGISGNAGDKYANCASIWNTVMDIRLNTSIRQWAYEPMAKHFPNVHVADYQSTDTDAWMKPVNSDGGVMGTGGNNLRAGNTPYYAEQLYHLCMYDPKPFVAFFNTNSVKGEELKQCATIVNDLLCEMNRIVGYADRKPIETPVDWNSEFVISGMQANGKNYWRITPNRDLTTKEKFKVKDSDPTFSLAGQTVTFPSGKIIADTQISTVGTLGYWVETPTNKTPVITSDAHRFETYPAYSEDYESYNTNSTLNSGNVRDPNAWIVNAKGSDIKIESHAGSKVLAVTGNSLLENKLIPANLTLGDAYAKKQSWEVTITIPDGIGSNAKMTLLNYSASGTDCDDGGFKLQGNTLYYATGEADADFAPVYEKLLDVKAGTYTLKRDMNFGQSYFCTYTVSDGSGKVLKTAEKIPVPAFSEKVKTIGLTCENMNKKILLDNYTLRVTGAGADLYLYDTTLGTAVADGAKHTASVTYRLSWANASEKNETATVKAEIGNAVKTLQTITMKPGCNGVEYGTVDVKNGQSVRVYLETSIKDEKLETPVETEPTESETQPANTTKATIPALSKPTRATKTPTRATKITKATQPTKATVEALATEATALTETTSVTTVTEATEPPVATDATGATVTVTDEKNGSDNTVLIIVIAAVAVLAIAGGLTFFLLKKKKPAPDAAEATKPDEPESPKE